MARKLSFPVFDADNHMYETTDAFTKYLPEEYSGIVKYVEVNGRTKIAIKNKISEYIPNPTFNVVAAPGAQELEFKLKNPSSKTKPGDKKIEPPPRYVQSIPAYFDPEPRLELLDELGIEWAMMWPTLASLLEERLSDDPRGTHAVIHAFNQWMHEHWTYSFEDRIFPTPVITLPIVDEALRELDYVVEHGARAVLIRPAPVPDLQRPSALVRPPRVRPLLGAGRKRPAVLVGMHASDSGFQRYLNEWEGHDSEFLPFAERAIRVLGDRRDRLAHRVRRRRRRSSVTASPLGSPKLRFMPVENGSAWVRPLVDQVAEDLRAHAGHIRRGPDGDIPPMHLRPPVPRGGHRRAGQAGRRGQRASSARTIRTPRACSTRSPSSTRSMSCQTPTKPRSWAGTWPSS